MKLSARPNRFPPEGELGVPWPWLWPGARGGEGAGAMLSGPRRAAAEEERGRVGWEGELVDWERLRLERSGVGEEGEG